MMWTTQTEALLILALSCEKRTQQVVMHTLKRL